MKQIPDSILTGWMAWEVDAIDKAKFFTFVDEYILKSKDPDICLLDLVAMDSAERNTVRQYFAKNVLDLNYDVSIEYKYKLLCLAFSQGLLNVKQASVAIVKYLLDDEWGVLNSPNEDVNELYDCWVSGSPSCGDDVYYEKLENILRRS